MKLLIIENTDHYKIISNLYKLFSSKFEVKILIKNKLKKFISNVPQTCFIHFFLPNTFIFLLAVFKAPYFDKILISSGTEYKKGISGFFYSGGLFLLIKLFPKKVILNIRNIDKYLKTDESSLNSYLRIKLAENAEFITFETKSLAEKFKQKYKGKCKNIGILYVYYSDYYENTLNYTTNNEVFTIGILGYVNPLRRDYEMLYSAMKNLKKEVKIIFLGKCSKKYFTQVSNIFESKFELQISDKYLSDNEFYEYGKKCDILVAPLKQITNIGIYGQNKGTGALGDAISLNKNLIIPLFADSEKEFCSFSEYYENTTQLSELIEKYMNIAETGQKFCNFEEYSCEKVLEKFITI